VGIREARIGSGCYRSWRRHSLFRSSLLIIPGSRDATKVQVVKGEYR
jgi:hypothetical protein